MRFAAAITCYQRDERPRGWIECGGVIGCVLAIVDGRMMMLLADGKPGDDDEFATWPEPSPGTWRRVVEVNPQHRP